VGLDVVLSDDHFVHAVGLTFVAGVTLLCWTVALTAGRPTAYLGAAALAKGGR
jgi:hypothetical protein